jgi:hypothetical protein
MRDCEEYSDRDESDFSRSVPAEALTLALISGRSAATASALAKVAGRYLPNLP